MRTHVVSVQQRQNPATGYAHDFVIVDVETTGLDSSCDRIVQVAVRQIDRHGRVQQTWDTLVHPRRDPGPVEIHGITLEMLEGAPEFSAVAHLLTSLLHERVLVAHNASFDWGFLKAESSRAASLLTASHRLCTLALARRLDLDVPNFKLGTLAAWANIKQTRAHSAADDARVLEGVFRKLLVLAVEAKVPLPMSSNTSTRDLPWQTKAPARRSKWLLPGPWTPPEPLVQGMKFVVTGETRTDRAALYQRAMTAGLVPMNSVSGRTRFIVCNDTRFETGKVKQAVVQGIPVVDEKTFDALLKAVLPGVVEPEAPIPALTSAVQVVGPFKGYRVVVLGGPHAEAARVRDQVAALGGRIAVNITPTVSHVVVLDGAESDPRWARTLLLRRLEVGSVRTTSAPSLSPAVAMAEAAAAPSVAGRGVPAVDRSLFTATAPRILRRGEATDLPVEISKWELFVSWTLADPPLELDVFAFVTGSDEKVLSDEHFVFFDAPESPGGEVRLMLESDSESLLRLDLDELANPGVRVIVGASLAGGRVFGEAGPVELTLRDADGAPWARSVLDAGTSEVSLVLAEFYQRGDRWRVRAVGQGYEEPLASFAVRHGVDVSRTDDDGSGQSCQEYLRHSSRYVEAFAVNRVMP